MSVVSALVRARKNCGSMVYIVCWKRDCIAEEPIEFTAKESKKVVCALPVKKNWYHSTLA